MIHKNIKNKNKPNNKTETQRNGEEEEENKKTRTLILMEPIQKKRQMFRTDPFPKQRTGNLKPNNVSNEV